MGPQVEATFVEISVDGVVWESVGSVSGSVSSIDIDAFGFTSADEFSYVRLMDDPNESRNTGDTVGADIDAVGAIATVRIVHLPQVAMAADASEEEILLSFPSLAGSRYTIEASQDLINWSDLVVDIAGDGTVKEFSFEMTAPQRFFRLAAPDAE